MPKGTKTQSPYVTVHVCLVQNRMPGFPGSALSTIFAPPFHPSSSALLTLVLATSCAITCTPPGRFKEAAMYGVTSRKTLSSSNVNWRESAKAAPSVAMRFCWMSSNDGGKRTGRKDENQNKIAPLITRHHKHGDIREKKTEKNRVSADSMATHDKVIIMNGGNEIMCLTMIIEGKGALSPK